MDPTQAEDSGSLYVYGIVDEDVEIPDVTGVGGGPVTSTSSGGYAALVSEVADPEAIGTPENLVAHGTVLDRVAAEASVLPMTFGTIVPNEDTLKEEVLAPRIELYEENMQRVRDAVQFFLRACFVPDVVLAELVSEDSEIASLREAISGTSEDETREERIRLGQLVVEGLQRKAEAETPQILDTLTPLAKEIVERERGQAEDVIELAALVERSAQARFEDAAEELARKAAGRITFRLMGPQAPYDFVRAT
jgi:hypothetical protein